MKIILIFLCFLSLQVLANGSGATHEEKDAAKCIQWANLVGIPPKAKHTKLAKKLNDKDFYFNLGAAYGSVTVAKTYTKEEVNVVALNFYNQFCN